MFLCVCARAVCVCNLSLFVRKPFCRPIVPGLLSPPSSPTSSTLPALLLLHHPLHFCSALSHFFHFVVSLIPLLSSSRLASPSPSFVLAQKKIKRDCSVSEFSRLPRGQMTFPPPPGVESEKPSCVKFTTGRTIFSKHLASPSPLLSHTPSHLFITLLSFYSISNTSPTLQPCRSH